MPSPYRDPSNAASKKFRAKANPQGRHHPTSTATRLREPALPTELVLLRILSYSLADTIKDPKLQAVLQAIKGHLYEKEFLKVFKEEKYLKAYAVRWVPSRSLAFREMFTQSEGIAGFLRRSNTAVTQPSVDEQSTAASSSSRSADKIICIGGGAGSELLALGCAVDELCRKRGRKQREVHLVDIGPYEVLVDRLVDGLKCSGERVEVNEDGEDVPGEEVKETLKVAPGQKAVKFEEKEPPTRVRTGPDLTNGLITKCHRMDVFVQPDGEGSKPPGLNTLEGLLVSMTPEQTVVTEVESKLSSALDSLSLNASTSSSTLLPGRTLLTLLFTITELLLQSRPQTLLLLRRITNATRKGDLLLIADSANEEASAVAVGQERAFPVTMLVDHILCGAKGKVERDGASTNTPEGDWSLVEREDTKWYRLRDDLQEAYPAVKLENMRYWLRLYRRN